MRINDLAGQLVHQGHQVTVITGEPNYPEGRLMTGYKKDPSKFNNYNGVNILRVPIITRGHNKFRLLINYLSFFLSASIFGFHKLRHKKFDIIFANQLSPIISVIPGIFLKKSRKIPMVLWVLDLWPETLVALNYVRNKFLFRALDGLSGWVYKNSDVVMIQSEGFRESIKRSYKDHKSIIFRPNWAESIFKRKYNKPEAILDSRRKDKLHILFAGNIGSAQDFDSIIKAAILLKENKKVFWHIFGDGSEIERIRAIAKKESLSANFIFYGSYPLESMPFLYQSADVLLITLSKGDAFSKTIPGKLQSYMSSGKPILSMIDGETNEIIKKAKCGLVAKAGDYECLAKNVNHIFSLTNEERAHIGERAEEYYNNNFERSKAMADIEKTLINCIKDHSA